MAAEDEQREPDAIEGVPPPEAQRALVGHRTALEHLRAQFAAGRLPGGILLQGPRGIGKATLAFEFAREVFIGTSDEDPAHIVEQVAAGAYPNLFVLRIAPKKTGKGFYTVIRVEQVSLRENSDEKNPLIQRLHLTRGRRGQRIVVVDSIDDCNESTTNALLKILEEPPPDTTFLLISHRPGSLLPTIHSRCHAVALRPLDDDDVRQVLAANRPDVAAAVLELAVGLAGGAPRRGFEALLLGDAGALGALRNWLADPARPAAAAHLDLADKLASRDSAEARFGRDLLLAWLAGEARSAAIARDRGRLASANELWEKANALFADTDEYNLDMRQTLLATLDSIKRHALSHPLR